MIFDFIPYCVSCYLDENRKHTFPRYEESAPLAKSEAASRIGSHSLEEASDVEDQLLKVRHGSLCFSNTNRSSNNFFLIVYFFQSFYEFFSLL